MDSILPKPEDHCRVQILVKPVGQFSSVVFERLLKKVEDRLDRVDVLTSQSIRRVILPKFVSETNPDLARFTELQAFRKIFGLICIGQYNGAQLNASSSSPDLSPPNEGGSQSSRLRRSSLARMPSIDVVDGEDQDEISLESKQMAILKGEYQKVKQQFNDQLVDSRCVLFGFNSNQNSTEILSFPRSDDFSFLLDQLESVSRELLRSIYVVLDSKRLDTSFERIDAPPCLLLPDEEKYRMGVENTKSKNYRKKCIGRLRKRVADYALLTGYFEYAVQTYQSAIDLLKSTSDLLWLAAALEGWCCAAMMARYGNGLSEAQRKTSSSSSSNKFAMLQRSNQTAATNHSPNINGEAKAPGHHRYRSDEAAKIIGGASLSLLPNANDAENNSSPSSGETSPQFERQNDTQPANQQQNKANSDNSKRKIWRQLLNFDALSSAHPSSGGEKHSPNMLVQFENLSVPSSSAMSSASRSASAQNLVTLGSAHVRTMATAAAGNQPNGPTRTTNSPKNAVISRSEFFDRFRQSLENYGRFSFAVNVEYECVMRAVHLPIVQRQFIDVESFLREHTCRFLDDKFTTFNNTMKSNICLATAQVYNQIGFKRKFAFFLRLAVFFRLYMESHLENDYKKVYPFLNESLAGYGIGWNLMANNTKSAGRSLKSQFLAKIGSPNTFSLQIKAVHEVFTVAMRSNLFEIATRHLCFMLETFFDHLDKAASLALVEELNKLNQQKRDSFHDLEKPITLDSCPPVFLPPMQFTRFPTLKDFSVHPLPAHLAPRIIDTSSLQSKIFIYSPFQDRFKSKNEVHWVVDCASGVSVRAENPLPIELVVNNLRLLTEGCAFEAIPIRLNLPSCYGPGIDQSRNDIKLLGVPRSVGTLKITGYTCEVLGCRNVCKFSSQEAQSKQYTVRVLPHLPILQLETSLRRAPTLSDNPNEAIAEVCVFSGQSFTHSITLYNSSQSIPLKSITVKIQQPHVAAGPKLLKIVEEVGRPSIGEEEEEGDRKEFDCQISDLEPGERRKMDILIYGMDPTTAIPSENAVAEQKAGNSRVGKCGGDEQKVYVRRATSTSLATILTDSGVPEMETAMTPAGRGIVPREGAKSQEQQAKVAKGLQPSASTPLLEQQSEEELDLDSAYHDLIPYTGRLLSAEFAFTYTADIPSEKGEQFVRFCKLPLAITIVPAVNVSNWHILAGDNPFTRYIVVDVFNQTDSEAELEYGLERRRITVQAKEICRVPLLCPCCTEIKSIAFQRAAQRASHMMQMQEIERLRRTVERHVTKHLEIQWTIPHLNLNGQVPVGSLLSSVSFLRQLVLPSLTISMAVDGQPKQADGDINVGAGSIVNIDICLFYSISGLLTGNLTLGCFQDLQISTPVERPDNLLICGQNSLPFSIEGTSEEDKNLDERIEEEEAEDCSTNARTTGQFKAQFSVIFCYEGVHKVRPKLNDLKIEGADEFFKGQMTTLNEEDIFMPALSFSVINKL